MIIFRCMASATAALPVCAGILSQRESKVHFKLWLIQTEEVTSQFNQSPERLVMAWPRYGWPIMK